MAEILIVDDDKIIRDTLYELLSASYACKKAGSAEDALSQLARNHFHLVITDISLPGLTGSQLLRKVLQSYPETPVIIISGYSDQDHAQSLITLGAFDYLLKPFRLEVVEASVKRALESKRRVVPDSR